MNFADRLHNLGDGWSDAEGRVAGCDRGPRNDVYGWPRRRLGRRDECRSFCEFQNLSNCFFLKIQTIGVFPWKTSGIFVPISAADRPGSHTVPAAGSADSVLQSGHCHRVALPQRAEERCNCAQLWADQEVAFFKLHFFYQFIVFQIRRDLCICLLVHRTAQLPAFRSCWQEGTIEVFFLIERKKTLLYLFVPFLAFLFFFPQYYSLGNYGILLHTIFFLFLTVW